MTTPLTGQLVAIDPGPRKSAYVQCQLLSGKPPQIIGADYADNVSAMNEISARPDGVLAIEMIANYGPGSSAGKSVFRTCLEIGRMAQIAHVPVILITRPQVMLSLVGSMRGGKAAIRAALIELYGPGEGVAIGGKQCVFCAGRGGAGRGKNRITCITCEGLGRSPKGPLHGMNEHVRDALAVAIAYQRGVGVRYEEYG